MADQERIVVLEQGVDAWNQWRNEHPETVYPNLSYADLSHTNFSGVNFTGANLVGTDFTGTNLSEANLIGANLSRAILTGTGLDRALIGAVVFGDNDLSGVKGLDTVKHIGPSTIGIDTLIRSQGKIPEIFLQNAGVPESIIKTIPSLVGSISPINYYSCFISYSSKDKDFVERLYADLLNKGVRCWYAPEDLEIGAKIRLRIEESIRVYDKLLIVLSENSISSNWVAYEVERAINKEPVGIPNVLFPIRLDDAVMHCDTTWANDIRSTRNIGDFSNWKNYDAYQRSFNRLLRALKLGPEKLQGLPYQ